MGLLGMARGCRALLLAKDQGRGVTELSLSERYGFMIACLFCLWLFLRLGLLLGLFFFAHSTSSAPRAHRDELPAAGMGFLFVEGLKLFC